MYDDLRLRKQLRNSWLCNDKSRIVINFYSVSYFRLEVKKCLNTSLIEIYCDAKDSNTRKVCLVSIDACDSCTEYLNSDSQNELLSQPLRHFMLTTS